MPGSFRDLVRNAHVQVAAQGYTPRGTHDRWTVNAWLERRRGTRVCPECMNDRNECSCHTCPVCQGRTDAPCGACGRCDRCCRCSRYLTGYRRHSRDEAYPMHGTASVFLPRTAAVEIECGTRRNATRDHIRAASQVIQRWKAEVHSDGSISGLECPAEICTAPARGESFRTQITEVTTALIRAGASVNRSCGLHVHVGVGDLTDAGYVGVCATHAHVEAALFMLVSPSRRGGQWCRSAGDRIRTALVGAANLPAAGKREAIEAAFYGSREEARYAKQNKIKHGCRYHSLNINATALYGTIENRMHQGTLNRAKIVNWTRVVVSVVEWGKRYGEDAAAILPADPWQALMRVVPEDLRAWCEERRTALARGGS